MGRIGTNPNVSSDTLEARMLPDVEEARSEGGADIDIAGDGVHKIYLHRGQLDIYNFGANSTKILAARGFGKTSYIGLHMVKCTLGMRRQMGGFVGASAKQLYTRTMPNALKVINTLGFEKFYFLGQPPAKLHWEVPLARPRVWENCVSFANGFVWQMLSMAVRGSANGLNLAALVGDEVKYLPWQRVKEEVLPTLRGDFMPPSARKVEKKQWGYGTDKKTNPYYCSQLWVSDAGLTMRQCEWEKEEDFQTTDINKEIAQMLGELAYLTKHNPAMAVRLAQNENYLSRLNLLRSQAECFFRFSSLDNLSLLGGEAWLRQMKRELPPIMFERQILGLRKTAARDGFYSNWDSSIHMYSENDAAVSGLIRDRFTHKVKGRALDSTNWMQSYETESLNLDECVAAADGVELDTDLDFSEPLRFAIDAGANMNVAVLGQTRCFEGRESLLIQRVMYVQNERKLLALCSDITKTYDVFRRRGGTIIFYFTATIKQGASTAYAVEGADDYRFDKVVVRELIRLGWKKENVIPVDMGAPVPHELKHRVINSCLAFSEAPAIRVCEDDGYRNTSLLVAAIEQTAVVEGTYRKDKSREKLKSEEGIGGDPRTRTDVTDAFDDLILGVKYHGAGRPKIGGALRNRYQNIAFMR